MRYMLLLYVPTEVRAEDPDARAPMEAWNAYTEDLRQAGALIAVDALQGVDIATTVRERDGERLSPTARSPRPRRCSAATT